MANLNERERQSLNESKCDREKKQYYNGYREAVPLAIDAKAKTCAKTATLKNIHFSKNRMGTSQVGAPPKGQKAQRLLKMFRVAFGNFS